MTRRAQGIVVLLLAVLVALVVPRLDGTAVPGAPVALFVPPAPSVGSCVLQESRGATIAASAYGSCDRPHYGEVVQVFGDLRTFPQLRQGQTSSPDPSSCAAAVHSYLGVDQVVTRNDRGDYRSMSFGPWRPVSVGRVGLIGPAVLQQKIGQHWIACVTQGLTGRPYSGTVRGAFTGGSLPNSFAVCGATVLPGPAVDCAGPHRAEVFASTAVSTSMPSAADLSSSCTEFIQYLAGRADLSGGGRLRVLAAQSYLGVSVHTNNGQSDSVRTEPSQAFCGLETVGAAQLTGTVFALGNRALPLS